MNLKCLLTLGAATVLLNLWGAPDTTITAKAGCWPIENHVEFKTDKDGSMKFRLLKGSTVVDRELDVQPVFSAHRLWEPGTYQVKTTIQADKAMDVHVSLMLNPPPYTQLGKRQRIHLEPNKPYHYTGTFSIKEKISKPIRVPGLRLLNAENGSNVICTPPEISKIQ